MAESEASEVHVIYRHETPAFEETDWSWVLEVLVAETKKNPLWWRSLSTKEQVTLQNRISSRGLFTVRILCRKALLIGSTRMEG